MAPQGHRVQPCSRLGTTWCRQHHPPAPSPAPPQHHQQQRQCSKMPPPGWSCPPCSSAIKLPLCSLAPSAKRGPWEWAPHRPTLHSGIPFLPRSSNRAGADVPARGHVATPSPRHRRCQGKSRADGQQTISQREIFIFHQTDSRG